MVGDNFKLVHDPPLRAGLVPSIRRRTLPNPVIVRPFAVALHHVVTSSASFGAGRGSRDRSCGRLSRRKVVEHLHALRMNNPGVFLAGAHGLLWHRKIGIGERACCHADEIGHAPRLPREIGAAAAAEMKQHWKAARRRPFPCKRFGPFAPDIRARIECRHAERASCAPLAIATMAERDFRRRPHADK